NGEVLAFCPAQGAHRLPQRSMPADVGVFRGQEADAGKPGWHGTWEREIAPHERESSRCRHAQPREVAQDRPPPHRGHLTQSVTWAATSGGMVRPNTWAVRALMTRSNSVGWSTGKSAGRAPFRILST